METFSAFVKGTGAFSSQTHVFPWQTAVTRSFDAYFDQRYDKRLSKQWRRRSVFLDAIGLILTLL